MAEINFTSLQGSALQLDLQNIIQSALLLNNNVETSLGVSEDEGDVFQCGRCREQFMSLPSFFDHKKKNCKAKSDSDDLTQSFSLDAVTTETAQVLENPIILSFAVNPDEIDSSSASQPLQVLTNGSETQFLQNTLTVSTIKTVQIVQQGDSISSDALIPAHYVVEETRTIKEGKDELMQAEEPLAIALSVEEPISSELEIVTPKKETDYQLKCQFCGKQFRKRFDLQQHLRSHTGERPYQCIVCGRAFAQKSNVMKHMASHKVWPKQLLTLPKNPVYLVPNSNNLGGDKDPVKNVIVDQSFACQFCPSVFSNYAELKSHLKSHENEKVYQCIQNECNATFGDLDAFLEHSQSHMDKAQYKCHICFCKFSSLPDLAEHQASHDTNKSSNKNVVCRKCKGRFSNPESLDRHLAMDSHSYPCSVCRKVFTSERFLRRHLVDIHSSKSTFPCPVCSKRFRTENYLNTHMLTHSDVKPFSCKVCLASFRRKDKLNRHKAIHEVVKPFRCPFSKNLGCNKEFNRRDKLNEHILSHGSRKATCCRSCKKFLSLKVAPSKLKDFCCVHEGKLHQIIHKIDKDKLKEGSTLSGTRASGDGDEVPTIEIVVMPVPSESSASAAFKLILPESDGSNPLDLSGSGGLPQALI